MRLIDADALIDRIPNRYEQAEVARWVNEMPTIEPERPTGYWIGNYTPYQCSHCGKHADSKTPYCRYCGSEMKGSD